VTSFIHHHTQHSYTQHLYYTHAMQLTGCVCGGVISYKSAGSAQCSLLHMCDSNNDSCHTCMHEWVLYEHVLQCITVCCSVL